MRRFELIDGEQDGAKPCADIWYEPSTETFGARVRSWASANDVPAVFSRFVSQGERDIPSKWVRSWVDERIPPASRQNIGSVLRGNRLDRYDPCTLLAAGDGKSSQDGFYIREVTAPFTAGAALGTAIARARIQAGLTQEDLAKRTGIRQGTLSLLEKGAGNPTVKTLERIAHALDKRLVVEFTGSDERVL